MPKCHKTEFLNKLREKLITAAKTIKVKDGVDIWTPDPLTRPDVTGFVIEYEGEIYVVEMFAETKRWK